MRGSFYIKTATPDLQKTIAQITKYSAKTRLEIEGAIDKARKAIGKSARQRVSTDSGGLKKSIRTSFSAQKVTGEVKAFKPHAHLVEFGARAATAEPKRKKAMTIDANGIRRFAKKASIPRRSARPFMKPAFEEHEPELMRDIKKAVQP